MEIHKSHIRHCMLHEFDKFSTLAPAFRVYVKLVERIEMTTKHADCVKNSEKETEAVNFMQGVGVL